MEYDKIDLIEAKAAKLLDDFRSDSDHAVYTNSLYFIIALFIVAIGLIYVFEGFDHLIFSLALLSLIPYKLMVGSTTEYAHSLSMFDSVEYPDRREYTVAKLKYLKSLIGIKLSRIKALRIVYMCCFPVLLYILSRLFIERPVELSTELIYGAMALLLGGVFWYFFFQKDIQDLEMDQEEIKSIINSILL